MINQKSTEAIRKAIKFKYDGHIGRLISIPNAHLDKIVPNKGIPIAGILSGFNKDSGKELNRYGDVIKSEISRVLEKLKLNEFSEEDKKIILDIIDEYCKPELYLKRFKIMMSSIERRSSSYGQKVDLTKKHTDIPRSLCEAYARNTTRRILSEIENELDCIIESFNSKNNESESKVSEVANCLELKPNVFGLGFNFNAIIDKLFKRKKT